MNKYQVDFSGASNIVNASDRFNKALQQTGATLGQMINQDDQRADRLKDEDYRRDVLSLQQTTAKRDTDKYNQELADKVFAQKAFAAYNQTPTRDYSALPSQLTDTDRGKAVIEAMSLTPEELANPTMPSAIAKMKNQQILSDEHNKSGQTMLESERFKNAVDATAKSTGGMAPLNMWEKQLAMEAAERAAMAAESERAQKAVEGLSKDRSELQRAGLKDATTLSAAEIRADSHGADKKDKKEPKGPKIYAAKDYEATEELLKKKYSFGPDGDKAKVAKVTAAAAAAKIDPNELYGIVSGLKKTGLNDTFDEEKVLDAIAAKKPVLTGGGYAGSNTETSRAASLNPMAGYAELLKQKDAAYKQAVAKAANMPLTQADVLAAREAKGATQLDELIAKLGATTSKAEVKPETRNVPAPVTTVEEKPVKTDNTKKMEVSKDPEITVKPSGSNILDKETLDAINKSLALRGPGRIPVGTTVERAGELANTIEKSYDLRDKLPKRSNSIADRFAERKAVVALENKIKAGERVSEEEFAKIPAEDRIKLQALKDNIRN